MLLPQIQVSAYFGRGCTSGSNIAQMKHNYSNKLEICTLAKLDFKNILFLIIVFVAGCFSNNRNALNESNSFYINAEKLKREGKFNNSVEAFFQCLRHSPGSYKAHLQLAMIFEDNLDDLSQAIVHYQHYINKSPEKNQTSVVEKWLQRAEKKYYNSLKMKYEEKDSAAEPEVPQVIDEKKLSHQSQKSAEENNESFYVVREGDTLNQIAKDFLGDYKYWSLLYEANADILISPEQLQVGQRLIIPQLDL